MKCSVTNAGYSSTLVLRLRIAEKKCTISCPNLKKNAINEMESARFRQNKLRVIPSNVFPVLLQDLSQAVLKAG